MSRFPSCPGSSWQQVFCSAVRYPPWEAWWTWHDETGCNAILCPVLKSRCRASFAEVEIRFLCLDGCSKTEVARQNWMLSLLLLRGAHLRDSHPDVGYSKINPSYRGYPCARSYGAKSRRHLNGTKRCALRPIDGASLIAWRRIHSI